MYGRTRMHLQASRTQACDGIRYAVLQLVLNTRGAQEC